MIPSRAHWIWFGGDLPEWAERNIEEFRIRHPGWTIQLWQEFPADFPPSLRRTIETIPWYSSRSDLLSYWLLWRYGGIYLDTDIVTLREFEPLRGHRFFLAPCQPEGHTQPHLNCALMGSEPESAASQRILDACRKRSEAAADRTRIYYGPALLTELLRQHSTDVSVLPTHYFYAIPDRQTAHRFWKGTDRIREQILCPLRPRFVDDEEPFAIHLWGVEGSSHRKVSET